MNISSAIKESLKIENGSQYTNYRVNNSIKNKIYQKISHNTSLLTDCTVRYTIVSMLPRLVLLLSYDMKNEQIRKAINISRRSHYRDWNFEFELLWIFEWHIQSVKSNSLEFGSRNLDRPIFKLKLWKNNPRVTNISTTL